MVSHGLITSSTHVGGYYCRLSSHTAGVICLFLWFGYNILSGTDYVLSRFCFSLNAGRVRKRGFGFLVFIPYTYCWRCQKKKCASALKRVVTCTTILACSGKGSKCSEGWWESLVSNGGGHVVYSWCLKRDVDGSTSLGYENVVIWALYLFNEFSRVLVAQLINQ